MARIKSTLLTTVGFIVALALFGFFAAFGLAFLGAFAVIGLIGAGLALVFSGVESLQDARSA